MCINEICDHKISMMVVIYLVATALLKFFLELNIVMTLYLVMVFLQHNMLRKEFINAEILMVCKELCAYELVMRLSSINISMRL